MKAARVSHACGRIRKDEQGQERVSVIVAGGTTNDGYLSSVEILDPEYSHWRSGPEFLSETTSSQMVEFGEEGGIILVLISSSCMMAT